MINHCLKKALVPRCGPTAPWPILVVLMLEETGVPMSFVFQMAGSKKARYFQLIFFFTFFFYYQEHRYHKIVASDHERLQHKQKKATLFCFL